MQTWQLQDAKSQFSELVRKAQREPQRITRNGQDAAVILSAQEYDKLTKPKPSFKDFLLNGPKGDLDISRDVSPGRDAVL